MGLEKRCDLFFSGEAAIFGRPWNRGPVATVVFQKWREPVRNMALYIYIFLNCGGSKQNT
jgi:hypothetical protein